MREAVIVSAARTPIGKAYRGAYNNTAAPTLASYSIKEAVRRAGIDPQEVEDVVMGCAQQQGSQALNIGRLGGIAGRASKYSSWYDNRPSVLIWINGYCNCIKANNY
jgi:acetyl-CoA C-acetyltransferase